MQPFIVFGVRTPSYTADMFGMGILEGSYHIPGSAVIISAGMQTPCVTSPEKDISVSLQGIYFKYVKLAARFTERAVAALVTPEDHVAVIWRKGNPAYPGPISAARQAGFEVIESDISVSCTGAGASLGKLRWLKNHSATQLSIVASKQPNTLLERAIDKDVNRKAGSAYNFWTELREIEKRDPESLINELNSVSLFAGIGGPDKAHAFINRSDADISELEQIFSDIASDIGIPVYRIEDEEEYYFRLFKPPWWEWHPIPQNWRRIVP